MEVGDLKSKKWRWEIKHWTRIMMKVLNRDKHCAKRFEMVNHYETHHYMPIDLWIGECGTGEWKAYGYIKNDK